jgi:3'-phosphoadenosine 5'-phosphosulfate (PAPS) 3'-phosphatase
MELYTDTTLDLSQDLNFAIELALDGGKILMDGYDSGYYVETKKDGSIVTSIDKSISDLICERVKKYNSAYGLLDEECDNNLDRFNKEFCWVTDPLDSTRDYVDRKDGFSVIIGLMHKGKSVLGVTYRPQVDELAYATLNNGAYLINKGNNFKLEVSDEDSIHLLHTRNRLNQNLEQMISKINPISKISMGGFSKVIEVAKGSGNLFISPPSNCFHLWDICGTSIILEEAGGKITDIYGGKIDFSQLGIKYNNGIIAASKKIHERVLNILDE